MTETTKKGILSFFQNVPSLKTKSNDKKKEVDDTKFDIEVDNEEPIILLDEPERMEEEEDDDVSNMKEDPDPSLIEVNKTIDKNSSKIQLPSELSELEGKEELIESSIIIEEVSQNHRDEIIPATEPLSSQDIPNSSIIEESAENSGNNDVQNKTSHNGTKPLSKKEQLKKEKELRKVKREQEQLLKKQRREEEKLKREKLREEEKLKKEEQREEEKRKKEQQKEEERIKREEMKKVKEEEKRKREEEKLKKENEKKAKKEAKERSQLRIGNFFKKSSHDSSKAVSTKSDYEKTFLPFYSKDNIIISTNLILSTNKLSSNKQFIDDQLSQKSKVDSSVSEWIKSKQTKRGYTIKFKAVTLLQQMTTKEKTDEELQILLSLIPQKYIKFYENVRPPFIGTYSKDLSLPISSPFTTEGTGYNYEYDSDLEWVNEEEEDGEGGDIDNLESGEEDEEEDDEEEGSEGEFDGFLDAEDPNSTNPSKKKIMGPLIPVVHLRNQLDTLEKDDQEYFHNTAAQQLVDTLPFPVDPCQKIIIRRQTDQATDNSPVKELSSGDKRNIGDVSASTIEQSSDGKKSKTLITEPKDLLRLFDEIQGSTFSLGTITEIAQKGLPQYSKLTIKYTIREYAARASPKVDSSRKWEIKNIPHWEKLKNNID